MLTPHRRSFIQGVAATIATGWWTQPSRAIPATLRFPATWKRVADPIKANNGSHLSPNQITSDLNVIPHSTGYRMYFTAYDSRDRLGIAQANSSDGLNWTTYKKAASPDPIIDLVLAPDAGRGVVALETAHALKTPTGQRRIYYTEDLLPDGATYAIGLSTSPDGITWTRKGRGPIFEPLYLWEGPFDGIGGVLEPSVLYDPAAAKYKMWYAALGVRYNIPTFRIGYAESADGIKNWTRRSAPVLDKGPAGAWDDLCVSHVNVIADPAGGYHMFYHGTAASEYVEGAGMQRGCVGHAYSLDGISWQRNPNNPIIRPRAGKFDAWCVVGPNAIFVNGKLRVYYSGFANPNDYISNVGVVEAG